MSVSIEDESIEMIRSRQSRTVRVSLPAAGRLYSRGDFAPRITATVGLSALVAIGPTNVSNVWDVTFSSAEQRTLFLTAGNFEVRGHRATVNGTGQNEHRIRLFWAPYSVPMSLFADALQRCGAIVKTAEYLGVRWRTNPTRAAQYARLLEQMYGLDHDAYRPVFDIGAHERMDLALDPADLSAPTCRIRQVSAGAPQAATVFEGA